ncbi:MAG: hypothetical protein RIB60_02275 [Phycisphaerales bacterium]
MAGTRLTITPPTDFDLARDVCSYGYFVLAPNHWDPKTRTLMRVLEVGDGPATAVITQPAARSSPKRQRGAALKVTFDRMLARAEQSEAKRLVARMLRLDETADTLRAFHAIDPRWKRSGRGRLFRSPTLFEDVIKTVTSCNVAWPSTVKMNERLCAVCGRKAESGLYAFPSAKKLSRVRAGTLRGRCSVGYRDQRMIDLAKLFARGEIDERWLEHPETPDDDVFEFLKTLPGIGPYAAGNIMQLLGRYSRLAIDTETFRHAKNVLGYTGTDAQLTNKIKAHYEPFGDQVFRSYWFELWAFYESKQGPSHTWERERTAKAFTAAQFKD